MELPSLSKGYYKTSHSTRRLTNINSASVKHTANLKKFRSIEQHNNSDPAHSSSHNWVTGANGNTKLKNSANKMSKKRDILSGRAEGSGMNFSGKNSKNRRLNSVKTPKQPAGANRAGLGGRSTPSK